MTTQQLPRVFTMKADKHAKLKALVKWWDDMPEDAIDIIGDRGHENLHDAVRDLFYDNVNEELPGSVDEEPQFSLRDFTVNEDGSLVVTFSDNFDPDKDGRDVEVRSLEWSY